ncbi:MAG: hypothetical protein QCI00_06090 [Candidatus Thermoplasmatota archaeon]|nr:hypothetical protein [Candidatus Thermoplasmatota archaeon]
MNIKYVTNRIMTLLFIVTCFSLVLSVVSAEPTVQISPSNPKPKDMITFTVTMPEVGTIHEISVYVQECDDDICFIDKFNETMIKIDTNTYEASVTLLQKDAVYLEYQLNYLTDDGWNSYPEGKNQFRKVNLDTSGQSTGNGDDMQDTPGFELIFFLFSIAGLIGLAYIKKKKS